MVCKLRDVTRGAGNFTTGYHVVVVVQAFWRLSSHPMAPAVTHARSDLSKARHEGNPESPWAPKSSHPTSDLTGGLAPAARKTPSQTSPGKNYGCERKASTYKNTRTALFFSRRNIRAATFERFRTAHRWLSGYNLESRQMLKHTETISVFCHK